MSKFKRQRAKRRSNHHISTGNGAEGDSGKMRKRMKKDDFTAREGKQRDGTRRDGEKNGAAQKEGEDWEESEVEGECG